MTDDTLHPDLQRIVEEMAPAEDRVLEITDPFPQLRELIWIAQQMNEPPLSRLLTLARRMHDSDS
jgi:hypothetical protein